MSEEEKTIGEEELKGMIRDISREEAEDAVDEHVSRRVKNLQPTSQEEAGAPEKFKRMLPFLAESFKKGDANPYESAVERAKDGVKIPGRAGVREKKDAELAESIERDLNTTNVSAGGALVETQLADELVPALTSDSVFMDAGPRVMDIKSGSMKVPVQTGTSQANWLDEGASISEQDLTFEVKRAETNKLAARVDVTREMLERNFVGLEDYIMEDMQKQISNEIDRAAFAGSGAQFQPDGLDNLVVAAQQNSASGTTFSDFVSDAEQRRLDLSGADVPEDTRATFMHTNIRDQHEFTLDGSNEELPLRRMVSEGQLFGDPLYATNNIPVSSSSSNVYFVEMSQFFMIRDTSRVRLEMSEHSQFSSDVLEFKAVIHMDWFLAHEEGGAITTGVSHV